MILTDLLYKEEVYEIIGAAMQVHNTLGPGFLEAVYQEAFEIELSNRSIEFKPQQGISIYYGEKQLDSKYIADFLIYDKIIVEIKAIKNITNIEEAQIINYLKASGLQLGLLINFGAAGKLDWKRIVKTSRVGRSKSV
jgi:GxxExxY protein